ncbi:putative lactonohydrolase [Caenibius tardaugens NBRC 16725]|uniref:Putative lactonohydrolase n=1 Tax=Caenibius tardaugens NBRC 16725 TaxID=1219035 RepID=U2Y9X7_9SPHN|nr:SMP-30/gluconolactonase/LRE family protein [Caenibius tardaugens]AZI35566.1 SMP-30/gluconolactonase/LRE family protein [Caenibius tardaugens NBRC 16725]GAD50151.1 putative lactonohydrolase [Caenibius tardaugens NBRC 16725]
MSVHEFTRKPDIAADGFAFAENPRWHDGRLWFADIHGGSVYAMNGDGALETVVTPLDSPSGIGFMPDGSLLVVAVHEMKIYRWNNGQLSPHADLSHMAKAGLNDMLVDPQGRAYAVQHGFDWRGGEPAVAAALLCVEPDGSVHKAADDMTSGNGMVLSPDGRTFIIAESGACRLSAFDRDAQGRLSNRRVFAQLPDGYYPDGICLDDTGAVWVSCCWGPGVIRVEDGGRITHLVPSEEGRNPFACVFGGPDRRTLYICTAEQEEPAVALAKMTSRIEAIDVGFAGAGLP